MVKTIPMIKSDYLKFLKKREIVGKPIIDKIGKLNTFYLPLSRWLYSIYVKDRHNNYGTVCSSIIGLPNKRDNRKSIFWVYRNSLSAQPSFKKLNVFS